MPQKLFRWNALLFSLLAYCGNSSEQRNSDLGNSFTQFHECLDALTCTEESFQEQCPPVSLYGIFPTEEALAYCLDQFKVAFYRGPFGDLACFDSMFKNPIDLPINPCGNTPQPFVDMDFNKIISYQRVSPDQLGFYCTVPCTKNIPETFLAPVPQLHPEEQTLLLHTGVQTATLELLLALYPSRVNPHPCFRVGYCVIPR